MTTTTTTTTTTHSIVIIGGSFAGLAVASILLRDIIPTLPKTTSYKVTVINPSEDFYWKIGAPRTIVKPDALPLDKALLPIKPHFSKYTAEQFELIVAYAQSIDPVAKTVSLSPVEGATTTPAGPVKYDTLVIASGTSFATNLWSTTGGSQALKAALKEIHEQLPNAESVVVAGGGAAGVETAGELGENFGSSSGKNQKKITLYSGTSQLLNALNNKRVGADAEGRLKKLGVDVIHNVQVVEHHRDASSNKTVLKLSDGSEVTTDVYIQATGDKPNTSFVPADWLTERGQVKTDPNTLRLNVPDVTGVYVFGSVGSYSNGAIADILYAKKAMLETLRNDLSGGQPGPRTKNIYKKATSDFQIVPIGSQQGVGILFGWKVPSFFVKSIKSKDFMIGHAPKHVAGSA